MTSTKQAQPAPTCPNCGNTMSKKVMYENPDGTITDNPDPNAKPIKGYARWYCPGCSETGGTAPD